MAAMEAAEAEEGGHCGLSRVLGGGVKIGMVTFRY